MKIQLLTATVILALTSATSVWADDEIEATNTSKNAIAIGGDSSGDSNYFVNYPYGNSYNEDNEAISGSIVMDDCGCWDDMTLTNKNENSLAVGYAGAGSIIIE